MGIVEDIDDMDSKEFASGPSYIQSPQTSECATMLAYSNYTARRNNNLSVILSHESGEDEDSDVQFNESVNGYGMETDGPDTLEMGK